MIQFLWRGPYPSIRVPAAAGVVKGERTERSHAARVVKERSPRQLPGPAEVRETSDRQRDCHVAVYDLCF